VRRAEPTIEILYQLFEATGKIDERQFLRLNVEDATYDDLKKLARMLKAYLDETMKLENRGFTSRVLWSGGSVGVELSCRQLRETAYFDLDIIEWPAVQVKILVSTTDQHGNNIVDDKVFGFIDVSKLQEFWKGLWEEAGEFQKEWTDFNEPDVRALDYNEDTGEYGEWIDGEFYPADE